MFCAIAAAKVVRLKAVGSDNWMSEDTTVAGLYMVVVVVLVVVVVVVLVVTVVPV